MANGKFLLGSLIAGAVGTAAYVLRDEEKRERLMHTSQRAIAQLKGMSKEDEDEKLREKVGHSDPHDLADNKMVDEGAMYSVLHFNEKQETEEETFEPTKDGAEYTKQK
ncbi:hypothetical protein B0H94_102229 [Salsuginibacillus halophilus]|uniref:Uncharacterized protein n=1 Tax=Salsuginibacillus halophilus TaxID=517424 RepID=A0A2P8HXJ9_9BACI|nr:hypothetical protein [Salsuginibacillus halophilus]PSL50952.1 hypothetical protein B0H94_102229 [Salsuginibacillus halophilus]